MSGKGHVDKSLAAANFNECPALKHNKSKKKTQYSHRHLTSKSQQCPVAHVALGNSMQVEALQQVLAQFSGNPQSHCSPGSTNPLPQTGESNKLVGLFRKQ